MRFLFIMFALVSLTACTYSPEQLRDSYNGLGEKYAKDIKQMAHFTPEQQAKIDGFGQRIQAWHRQQRLPNYAALLTRVGTQVQQDGVVAAQDLYAFVDLLNGYPHFHEAREVNHHLGQLAQELSNEQYAQVIAIMREQQRSEKEHLRSKSSESLQRSRVEFVNNVSGYLGVDLNRAQLDIVRKHAANIHDLREVEVSVYEQWYATMESLMAQRHQPDFPQRFAAHAKDNAYSLRMQQEPALAQANHRQAVLMLQDLLASLNPAQKAALADSLLSVGKTFAELSQ